ncbi:hypothetical protein [Kitasatospora camelliae]|uniref:Uncharacterized protein n=1 Tax=Kitasatospora camelliae TaxID=3156397 RepID=A0AAU8JWH1_9ACTN
MQARPADPLAALLGHDRVELRLRTALAALARLDRLARPYGPVVRRGPLAAFLLAPDTADLVPDLLDWLGWGAGLRLGLRPAGAGRTPRPRDAEGGPPRPERRPPGGRAVWLRPGGGGPALDLRTPDLLRLLDCLADACARDLLGLPPAP